MSHEEFYNDAVDRARQPGRTHEDLIEIMLGVIAESIACMADALEEIAEKLEES